MIRNGFRTLCLLTLTLLFTIIFSSSLLISANVGLLSGSCFQQRNIRLYLWSPTKRKKIICKWVRILLKSFKYSSNMKATQFASTFMLCFLLNVLLNEQLTSKEWASIFVSIYEFKWPSQRTISRVGSMADCKLILLTYDFEDICISRLCISKHGKELLCQKAEFHCREEEEVV